jgi:hypothetical protein
MAATATPMRPPPERPGRALAFPLAQPGLRLFGPHGGVPEWLNGAVSKTVSGGYVARGFESLPLRPSIAAASVAERSCV